MNLRRKSAAVFIASFLVMLTFISCKDPNSTLRGDRYYGSFVQGENIYEIYLYETDGMTVIGKKYYLKERITDGNGNITWISATGSGISTIQHLYLHLHRCDTFCQAETEHDGFDMQFLTKKLPRKNKKALLAELHLASPTISLRDYNTGIYQMETSFGSVSLQMYSRFYSPS